MSYPALSSTTLGAALDGITSGATSTAVRVTVASSTGMAAATTTTPATVLVVGNEAMTVTAVINSTTVDVQRGRLGTVATPHANGTTVYFNSATGSISQPQQFATQALVGLSAPVSTAGLPQFTTVVGSKAMDPNTGYVYMLVDVQAAMTVGDWCVIDANGLASALAASSKGRVGILVETIAASDTLSWVMVEGTYASASFTSDVTTAALLAAGVGRPTLYALTTTDGNLIFGATCTGAPSTTVSTAITGGIGTAYIANPWVMGVDLTVITS